MRDLTCSLLSQFSGEINKLTKLGRCDRTAELQTVELLKLLILLEEYYLKPELLEEQG